MSKKTLKNVFFLRFSSLQLRKGAKNKHFVDQNMLRYVIALCIIEDMKIRKII